MKIRTIEVGAAIWRNLNPLRVVTGRQMGNIDHQSQHKYGLSSNVLMENAGSNAFIAVRDKLWKDVQPTGPLVFVVGSGNNGGDGLVMARYAYNSFGKLVQVVLVSDKPSKEGAAADNLMTCRKLGIPVVNRDKIDEAIAGAEWIFDGIVGTGLNDKLTGNYIDIINKINTASAKVVSIDVPSGLYDSYQKGPMIVAVATVTMGLPKRCLYLPSIRTSVGEILVVSVGFPRALLEDASINCELIHGNLLARLIPPAMPDSHKGIRGHVGIFGSAIGTSGAGLLSCAAAARAGAGLVTLYTDPETFPLVASSALSTMCNILSDTAGTDFGVLKSKHRTLLVGPGWGLNGEKKKILRKLLEFPGSGVLDADGLTLLAQLSGNINRVPCLNRRWVLTPHPGEMARLLNTSIATVLADPISSSITAAERWNAIVILKGHVTYVTDGVRILILDASNPALGTGGTGDVLAGVVAGLLSRGLDAFKAASAAILIHSKAGEKAFSDLGWFLADDLLPYIGRYAWPKDR